MGRGRWMMTGGGDRYRIEARGGSCLKSGRSR